MLAELPFDAITEIKIESMDDIHKTSIDLLLLKDGLPTLPGWWDYHWTVEKDEEHGYTGNFPKRYKKYAMLEHGQKLSTKTVSDIGERIKSYQITSTSYYFDFTRRVNWKPGTYGESTSSCWWNSNNDAREALVNSGGFAVRSYYAKDIHDHFPPRGRAWVAVKPDLFCFFNAYGSYATSTYASVIGKWLNLPFRHNITFTNCRRSSGLVYINGSGSIIGTPAALERVRTMGDTVDFWIDVSEFSGMCSYCGYDLLGSDDPRDQENRPICSACRSLGRTRTLTPLVSIPV